ncbi:MAG: preprotein translocase subunit YajC [bacterium]
MINVLLMMSMAGSGGAEGGGNPLVAFLPFILIIVIMYFLMIRPQAKKQKEHKAMIASLAKGDKIMTSGGMIGTIAGIRDKDNILIVKVSEGVKIEFSRNSVAQVINKKSGQ